MNERIKSLIVLAQFVSDRDRLERSWLGQTKNEISSFEEVQCQFFDDLDIEEIIENSDLPVDQINKLSALKDALEICSEKFDSYSEPQDILKSKEWSTVEQRAKIVGDLKFN